eukprot:scaffold1146_cov399-Prasinococcus_capsulatus_cf.AAC.87
MMRGRMTTLIVIVGTVVSGGRLSRQPKRPCAAATRPSKRNASSCRAVADGRLSMLGSLGQRRSARDAFRYNSAASCLTSSADPGRTSAAPRNATSTSAFAWRRVGCGREPGRFLGLQSRRGLDGFGMATARQRSHANGRASERVLPEASLSKPSGTREEGNNDVVSILLLLLLYTLQGIPMGLCSSVPFLLQDSAVSYSEQAVFSLASSPFSVKLLWAPLVDSVFSSRVGHRKSWLLPIQLLVAIVMIGARQQVDVWIGHTGELPSVRKLTAFFTFLYFLMATQDIAVDGWALTMLSRARVGYASTCNSVGQTLGFFLANVGFLALNDEGTCNKYLRTTPKEGGMVTLSSFMAFWGWVFLVSTILICFKREAKDHETIEDPKTAYINVFHVLCLRPVQKFSVILLTCRIGFGLVDGATFLKLTEYGVPKTEIAFFSPLMGILGVVTPLALSSLISGPKPLNLFLTGMPLRLIVGILYAFMLVLAKAAYASPDNPKMFFYAYTLFCVTLHQARM